MTKLIKDFREVLELDQGRLFLRKQYQKLGTIFRALAFVYRRTLIRRNKLVVVVGSLGKTTTKRVVHAALDCPERNFSAYNYGTALAHNVLRIKRADTHSVIEAGVGGPGWMHIYARFLKPNIVVITSIASDHHRSFPTLEHTRAEKVKIIHNLSPNDTVFLNGDDPNVLWMASQTRAKVITFGIGEKNTIRAEQIRVTEDGLNFDAITFHGKHPIHSSLMGKHMIYPILAALAVAEYEGFDLKDVIGRINEVTPTNSRMQLLKSEKGFTIIDDSYKAGFETYFSAIDTLANLSAKRKFMVFGDIDDPPGNYYECLRAIGKHSSNVVDKIFMLTSTKRGSPLRAAAVARGIDFENVVFLGLDVHNAYHVLKEELQYGDVILIKGRFNNKIQRLCLLLMGHDIKCKVVYCDLKPPSCLSCPFVKKDQLATSNYFIKKYFK